VSVGNLSDRLLLTMNSSDFFWGETTVLTFVQRLDEHDKKAKFFAYFLRLGQNPGRGPILGNCRHTSGLFS
jgi:hypothetical protein